MREKKKRRTGRARALEILEALPDAIVQDIDAMHEEFKRDGKIKPRQRFFT